MIKPILVMAVLMAAVHSAAATCKTIQAADVRAICGKTRKNTPKAYSVAQGQAVYDGGLCELESATAADIAAAGVAGTCDPIASNTGCWDDIRSAVVTLIGTKKGKVKPSVVNEAFAEGPAARTLSTCMRSVQDDVASLVSSAVNALEQGKTDEAGLNKANAISILNAASAASLAGGSGGGGSRRGRGRGLGGTDL